MLKSGFFESVGSDRKYDTDSFNRFFEGLISPNGIFENVGDGFEIKPISQSLNFYVATGKAMVNHHWVTNDSYEVFTANAPHDIFSRYDMITLRYDSSTRDVTIKYTPGTAASTPVKPRPIRTDTQWEIALAYILMQPKSTEIMEKDIIDCRYDTEICGVITGLITQVDTTNLYRQYIGEFEYLKSQMKMWQEEQQRLYNDWFTTMTDDLVVDTHLTRTKSNVITIREDGTQYVNLPSELNYKTGDLLDVYVNGVLLVEGSDYKLMWNEVENVPMIFIFYDIEINNTITFYCVKSESGNITEILESEY